MANIRQVRNSLTMASLALILVGTVVAVPAAQAQTFTVIHTFTESGSDGGSPFAGVTLRGDALYGTTASGGAGGTVYQMTKVGSNWVTIPISNLSMGGGWTVSRPVFGPDSHLYSAAQNGGTCNYGGYVYKLTPPLSLCKTAQCYWREKDLHDFGCGSDGFSLQYGDLAFDSVGNVYGTTTDGGDWGAGIIYELQQSGNNWTENILYSFSGQPDGSHSFSGVIFDSSGNLYGTTYDGGSTNAGTVFELSYVPGVGWTEQVLHNFQSATDGGNAVGGLVFDASGNLYGTTRGGGSGGGGTVFELSRAGNSWTYKVLYSFSGQSYCGPWATLTLDNLGRLYGTTTCDGANSFGNVFKLTNTQNGWVYSSLYDFTNGPDGSTPISNVTIDASGNLYGTASRGGYFEGQCGPPNVGCGTVWMIKP